MLTDINSTADVWNISDDEVDKEESLRTDHNDYVHTDYSENIALLYQIFVLMESNI